MLHFHFNELNWIAIVVAGLAAFMVGGVWYQALFGNAWVKLQGFSDEQVAKMKAEMSPPKFFGGMIVSYFVLAFTMATLIVALDIRSVAGGAAVGFHFWLAIAAVGMTHHLASGKRIGAFFIDAGCELVYTPIMGAILALGADHSPSHQPITFRSHRRVRGRLMPAPAIAENSGRMRHA